MQTMIIKSCTTTTTTRGLQTNAHSLGVCRVSFTSEIRFGIRTHFSTSQRAHGVAWARGGTGFTTLAAVPVAKVSHKITHTHWCGVKCIHTNVACCVALWAGEPESASNFALAAHSLSQISAEVAILGFREFTRPSPCPSGPLRSHVYTETHAKNRAQTWIMLLKLGRGRVWERS